MIKRKCIYLLLLVLAGLAPAGCTGRQESTNNISEEAGLLDNLSWEDMQVSASLELKYATQFTVDFYGEDYDLITIADNDRYLLVKNEAPVPKNLDSDIVVLTAPLSDIYIANSAAFDFFRQLDIIDAISLVGIKPEAIYIDGINEAIARKEIVYAGKYSAPDYELILSSGCRLAVQNTMLYHTPEVKEKLEKLGIPVLVDYASYETHPLGRLEWIKLYGMLTGKMDEAEKFFDDSVDIVEGFEAKEKSGNTVAFFYINSNGSVNVRKSGDYISAVIAMAGAEYILKDAEDDSALSTINMQMEEFCAVASDADYIIYNSTVAGSIASVDELIKKGPPLADFKAVKENHVYCTEQNLYQSVTGTADLICDINSMINGDDDMKYLYRLR